MATSRQTPAGAPSPEHFFQAANAYQQSAALHAAVELDLFTHIAQGAVTPRAIAERASASERGVRMLCDYLVIIGFLQKNGGDYRAAPDAALFLDRNSPAYLGGSLQFIHAGMIRARFDHLADAVRRGGAENGNGPLAPEHPIWVDFARSMAPLMRPSAQWIAEVVAGAAGRPDIRVLDIAAGHGIFGITIAERMPQSRIVALDWPNVLEVASETAAAHGVADRHSRLPGDAFAVDYGTGFDFVLLTNFLHHFDPAGCRKILEKTKRALKPGGAAIVLEFVPNDDRVSPPMAAAFCLTMLVMTPSGDAYTYSEYDRMFQQSGFAGTELLRRPDMPPALIVART